MTKVIVTVDTKVNANLFLDMLNALKFVKKVETEELGDEALSAAEIQLLESRWKDYLKNTDDVQGWKEVKKELIKKHGR